MSPLPLPSFAALLCFALCCCLFSFLHVPFLCRFVFMLHLSFELLRVSLRFHSANFLPDANACLLYCFFALHDAPCSRVNASFSCQKRNGASSYGDFSPLFLSLDELSAVPPKHTYRSTYLHERYFELGAQYDKQARTMSSQHSSYAVRPFCPSRRVFLHRNEKCHSQLLLRSRTQLNCLHNLHGQFRTATPKFPPAH